MLDAIFFDLDGTLVDTLDDIASLMNGVLSRRGFPVHSGASYRQMVGYGMTRLAESALPEKNRTPSRIEEIRSEMMERYLETPVMSSYPYPGISKMLEAIGASPVKLAVISNKPDQLVKTIVKTLFPDIPFDFVSGTVESFPHKPDPAIVIHASNMIGAKPESSLFAGDSAVDVETGKNSGMITAGVTWGFRGEEELKGADYLISDPRDFILLSTRL